MLENTCGVSMNLTVWKCTDDVTVWIEQFNLKFSKHWYFRNRIRVGTENIFQPPFDNNLIGSINLSIDYNIKGYT